MQTFLGIITLALITSSISPAVSAPAAPSGERFPGWLLKQNLDYHGSVEVKATTKGCRIITKDIALFLRPHQDVLMFNDTNKTMAKINKTVWLNSQSGNCKTLPCSAEIIKDFQLPQSGTRKIAGLNCKQNWAVVYKPNKTVSFFWEYWTTNEIKLPPDVINDYRVILNLPSGDGLPLAARKMFGRHRWTAVIVTEKAEPTMVAAKDLIPPTGYRQVENEMDVILGAQDKDEMDKILGRQDDKLSKVLKGNGVGYGNKRH